VGWWPVVSGVAIGNLLPILQDSYLHAVVESMKLKPTETLEITICLTFLDMAVFGAARFPAYRWDCQEEWRNTGLEYMKPEFLHKYPFTLKQDKILKKYKLVKQYKTLIPAKEVWCMPGKIADPNVGIWTRTGQELATALVQV